jgi:hypothetical protein
LYYTDANSSQWVAATSDPVNIGVVANQSERDAQYPTPGQGMRVYRTDLGVTQTYYGLFNASTNPGGRDVAGWYDTEKSIGLVPIQPSAVSYGTGSGTVNALGQITFTNANLLSLDGVFTSRYRNYKILYNHTNSSTTSELYMRLRAGGADNSSSNYYQGGLLSRATATSAAWEVNASTVFRLQKWVGTGQWGHSSIELFRPQDSSATTMSVTSLGWDSSASGFVANGLFDSLVQFSGFTLIPQLGSFSGIVQVYGYNDK